MTARIFLCYFIGGSFPLQNTATPVSKQYSFVNQLPNLTCKVINLVIRCSCSINSPTNKCLLMIKKQYLPSPLSQYVLVLQHFCATMNLQKRLEVMAQISQNILQNAYIVNSSVPTVKRDMQQLAALLQENLQHICKIMKENKHF